MSVFDCNWLELKAPPRRATGYNESMGAGVAWLDKSMTTMISEVYSAFKTAGVPEQEAKQAAEAMSAENLATRKAFAEDKRDLNDDIASAEQRLSDKITAVDQKLSDKIADGQQQLSAEIGEVRRIMSVIRWMLGFMLVAMALPILREIIVA